MDTVNRSIIRARTRDVFRAAAELDAWPRLLPHYRRISYKAREGDVSLVTMAAHRDGFPCQWTSIQILYPDDLKIYYRHLHSFWTRGMEVWWTIKALDSARTEVIITHALRAPSHPFAAWFYRVVIGKYFVESIAGRTLAGLKRHLEAVS